MEEIVPRSVHAFIEAAREHGLPAGREGRFYLWIGHMAWTGKIEGNWSALTDRAQELVRLFLAREEASGQDKEAT